MTSRGQFVAALCALAMLASCSRESRAPSANTPRAGSSDGPGEISPKRPSGREGGLSALAESYVRTTLELAQHDPELVDVWRGPEDWRPGPRPPVAPLLAQVESLQRDLARQPADAAASYRTGYLTAQAGALHLVAERLLGRTRSFNDEAREAFGMSPTAPDAPALERARAALDRELPGKGALVDRYAAFKRRLAIRPARVEAVMRAALDVCRTATLAHTTLPADESVDLVFVSGSPWDGYARSEGRHRTRVEINREAALDITRALMLACHEAYPGHHVQHLWIDDELVARRGWKEFQLTPAFGRHLLISEGAAEAGVDILFPDDKRTAVYRERLLPAAGLPASDAAQIVRIESLVASLEPAITDIVRGYLDSTLTQAIALERLRADAVALNAEAILAFAERRRTRVLAYPEGRSLVRRLIGDRGVEGLRRVFVDQPFAVQ